MPSLFESLTDNFYRWEKRCRGWQVWSDPVELEPAFEPFFHRNPEARPVVSDDGRKPTRVGSWIEKLKSRFTGHSENYDQAEQCSEPDTTEQEPEYFYDDSLLVEIQLSLTPEQKISKEVSERFILSLTSIRQPASFEIIGTHESIVVQVICREPDSPRIRQQLHAYFPDSVISVVQNYVAQHWNREDTESVVIDFGLSNEFMRPLREFKNFEVDPLIGIAGALSDLEPGELGILQVLFQPARKPWGESVMRSVTDWEGKSFFVDAPEMVGLAKEKIEHPLFAVVIRIGALSPNYERTKDIAISLGGALAQFARPGSNELIPLDNDEYNDFSHEEDLLSRQSRRSGMLLNASELVSLAHLPSMSVRSEKLKREIRRSKAAPSIALGHQLVLGENVHQGKTVTVTLNQEQRLRHTYVIGATGTGKSTLLLNMITQDIEHGLGVGVLDPQGDLIDRVLERILENRFDDVVLFDPADTDWPVGFNVLSAHSEVEKNILSSDLGAVFKRLATSWGDNMTSVLGNAILAFLETDEGGTLLDLRRFLLDRGFRDSVLKTVKDPEVRFYWQKQFPLLAGRPHASVLTRLDTFLRPKIIRNMVAQKRSRINFQEILNGQKIFLVKLAQGLIGEENAYLLGSFIVSKLHQVAMARQEVSEASRKDFYLYVDEFHNFITPSMASILSGARKYHMGLVLAHQDLYQLWNQDTGVANSVISNPYTRICFRLGDFDAKKLEDGFSFFKAEDLQNLGIGDAICRIERAEYDFNLKTLRSIVIDPDVAQKSQSQIIKASRAKYARPRAEVEAEYYKDDDPAAEPPLHAEKKGKAEKQETRSREGGKRREEEAGAGPHVGAGPDEQKPPPGQALSGDTTSESPHKPHEIPRTRPQRSAPATPGRGGQEHKRLQSAIRSMGQDKGYRATIEKEILGGTGKVDVALERDDVSIACEISVTTDPEQELGNIQKCLAAGFDHVALISGNKATLNKVRALAKESLPDSDLSRIQFQTSEEFFAFLQELDAKAASKEETVRGYKVRTSFKALNESEKKARKKVIAETILTALRKKKGPEHP
jgi:hypothetical protein